MSLWVLASVGAMVGIGWFIRALARAPIGLEDSYGFHVFGEVTRRRAGRIASMRQLRRQRAFVRLRPNLLARTPAGRRPAGRSRFDRHPWLPRTTNRLARFGARRPRFRDRTARDADGW